jgi:hypothetical protein
VASGVTITLGGASHSTTTTGGTGAFGFTGLANGSYTLTPSLAGYTFSPASLTVAVGGANVSGLDFVATTVPTTHSIPGVVGGAVAAGVNVTLGGAASATAVTAGSGVYGFTGLLDGDYTLTPSLAGYTFSPPTILVTLSGVDFDFGMFTATPIPPSYAIRGMVGGDAASGVTVTLRGGIGEVSTTTDGAGAYAFTGIANGSYSVTPSLAGFTFSPPMIGVTVSGADITGQDFIAAAIPPTFTVGGKVGGDVASGVTVYMGGAGSAATITDGTGAYRFTGIANGSYTVTPSLLGYTFSPANLPVTVSGADVTGRDFTATAIPPTYAIRGTVRGTVAAGVTVALGGAGNNAAVTNGAGAYAFTGLANGSYSVTPSLVGYSFSPASLAVTVSGADVTGRDFTASPLTLSSPVCSVDRWCWENPLPQGGLLTGIWGSSVNDVWAVGYSGTLLHWDGSQWSSAAIQLPLRGVWGASATDVWAVGERGTILHWNGAAWAGAPSGTTSTLFGVWGVSTGDVWAVGDAGTILHWNGSAWSSVASGTANQLSGVWGASTGDVWAVGDAGTILRWSGSAWSSVASGTVNQLSGVWGSSGTDVWAVGAAGTILRWSGGGWSGVASGTTTGLLGVWGSSWNDVWAAGSGGVVTHWDGATWSGVPGGTASSLQGVWGSSGTDVWAVGAGGVMMRWNGASWSSMTTGTTTDVTSVWGRSASDVWAVGAGGTILHWTGGGWSGETSGTTSALLSVRGTASDVWAVGVGGTALHRTGSTWSGVASGTTNALDGVWALAPDNAFAVGGGGTVLWWNGTAWLKEPTTTTAILFGIWNFWSVGSGGTILNLYTPVASGTAQNLFGVWGSSASDVWAVGQFGTALRYDGSAWSSVARGTLNDLNSVWGSSASDVWAVGGLGTIVHWDGLAWSAAESGTTTRLTGVWASSTGDVWVVGQGGAILRHRP